MMGRMPASGPPPRGMRKDTRRSVCWSGNGSSTGCDERTRNWTDWRSDRWPIISGGVLPKGADKRPNQLTYMCGESKSPGIAVNYGDRRPDEPMTAQPSDGKSVYLKLDAETVRGGGAASAMAACVLPPARRAPSAECLTTMVGSLTCSVNTLSLKRTKWLRMPEPRRPTSSASVSHHSPADKTRTSLTISAAALHSRCRTAGVPAPCPPASHCRSTRPAFRGHERTARYALRV